jgi:CDP-glucose 4,6-dehydratase
MDYKKKLIKIFNGKKVIVTGHTGFKGSWLAYFLTMLGANVVGVSDKIISKPSHYSAINLKNKVINKFFNISNKKKINNLFIKERPDFVFHLAAQALVKKSYINPMLTWTSNTLGTLSILEALKNIQFKKKCICIFITSDKSYRNIEINRGYKESDSLGGKDPYSASKASADIAVTSYFYSFFFNKKSKLRIAIARAGNVIGGGDWSKDRLIPDCIKDWTKKKTVYIRNPESTRPWQHVLDIVNGYLLLALNLNNNKNLNGEAFNFGPSSRINYSVGEVVKEINKNWPEANYKILKKKKQKFYESKLLRLNSSKAKKKLKWKSILTFKESIKFVSDWYKEFRKDKNLDYMTKKQILMYINLLNIRSNKK